MEVMMGMVYLMLWLARKLMEVLIIALGAAGTMVIAGLLLLHKETGGKDK